MKYDFVSPTQIAFGWGRRTELAHFAAEFGDRVFLISGSRTLERNGIIPEICERLNSYGLSVSQFNTEPREPEVGDVDSLVTSLLERKPAERDVVIAIGGGSTIDLAKAAAALVRNRHGNSVVEFLEGVGRGLQITERPLPVIAVPTTSGTGAEVTKNSVISCYQPAFKKSLRSNLMIPTIVLIDPELTVSLPPSTTAYTGMDAITQLIESYISRRAAPIPRALAISGLELAVPALPCAVLNGSLRHPREAMAQAALLSGLALANSGLGLAHGVAAALGVHCKVPHGLACAVMLPTALRVNLTTSESDLAKLERLFDSRPFTDTEAAQQFICRIETLCDQIGIPKKLRDLEVKRDQIPNIVQGSRGNSMSGNPRDVSDEELTQVLDSIW